MDKHNQYELLTQKRFLPFFLTQFMGAFNDNVFKNALVLIVTYNLFALAAHNSDATINLLHGLFILPFFLFSATSGQIADKYEKSGLIRRIKIAEIGIMLCAVVGLYLESLSLLIGVLFFMGAQSTLFGPIKYGILPQVLNDHELVGGNGLVEMGTFVSILLGTILGGILVNLPGGPMIIAVTVVISAIIGYLTSRHIPEAKAAAPDLKIQWNIFRSTYSLLKITRKNRVVFLSVLGISWFWFFGSVILAQIPNFNKNVLGGGPQVFALMLSTFSMGIAVGSLWCEKLSRRKVEIGLVPLGSIGLSLITVDLYFAASQITLATDELLTFIQFFEKGFNYWRILIDMFFIGIFGGFYIVPLYALIQQQSDKQERSRVIAGNNVLNALFMVVAAGMSAYFLSQGMTIPELFLVTALLNALVAIYIYRLIPEFLVRFMVWLLMHTLYRLKEEQLENIPDEEAAVIVSNHVSYVDALIILGASPRPIRFVMDHNIFKIPLLNYIFRTAKAIPIASEKENPETKAQAFVSIAQALNNGELVCIFPEGKITDTGEINVFKSGIEQIIQTSPVPVIPLALKGFWGSFFSRAYGKAMSKPFRRFWSKVSVIAGKPVLAEDVSAAKLQEKVLTLRGTEK
ncbi:MAG: MFS transporter [Pseudomonadota bacterium]